MINKPFSFHKNFCISKCAADRIYGHLYFWVNGLCFQNFGVGYGPKLMGIGEQLDSYGYSSNISKTKP